MNQYYERFLHYFKEVSKIPRNLKQESKIADYLVSFAKWKNFHIIEINIIMY